MEQPEIQTQLAEQTVNSDEVSASVRNPSNRAASIVPSQANTQTCANCGSTTVGDPSAGTSYTFVYALGGIEARFPTVGVEKEFAQATGRAETKGLTDRQALYEVLRQERYLVRQLCWVFVIQGLETYILLPRDPADYEMLVEALRRNPSPMDLDVIIGLRGPIARPEMCNGLMVPIVAVDQLYSFDRDTLLKSIPRPKNIPEDRFRASTEELFDRIMQMTDNAGMADEHRALNYLAVRYPAVYTQAAEGYRRDESLTAVDVRPSPLSGTRNMVDVIFSFTNRSTDVVDKFSVRVDVTEEFPFLASKLSPYLDR